METLKANAHKTIFGDSKDFNKQKDDLYANIKYFYKYLKLRKLSGESKQNINIYIL